MPSYMLTAEGHWVDSYEYQGGKRDCHDKKSANLSVTFEVANAEEARTEGRRLLAEFKESLPQKREGSLSWQDKDPVIKSVVFSRVMKL